MNMGFFGIQFSFGITQTAMSRLFSAMGATAHDLPILTDHGLNDQTRHRAGQGASRWLAPTS